MDAVAVQQRASQAVSGLVSALQDISQELHDSQQQLQYWKLEADAWKARYEQERARSVRLRRVLRCTPLGPITAQPSLSAQPSLVVVSPTAGPGAAQRRRSADLGCASGAGSFSGRSTASLRASASGAAEGLAGGPAGAAAAAAPAGDAGGALSPRPALRPLKCVAEEAVAAGGGGAGPQALRAPSAHALQDAAAAQPGSAHTPRTFLSASSTEGTPHAAACGDGALLQDPFARVQCAVQGTVSDPGEAALHLQQQQEQQQQRRRQQQHQQQQQEHEQALASNGGAGAGAAAAAAAAAGAALAPAAAAAAAGGGEGAVVGPDGTPLPFRRSRTLPHGSSLPFVARSPRFTAGGGMASAPSMLGPTASWLPPQVAAGSSRHTVDQLLRVMMAFTLMQGGAAGDADGQPGADGAPDEDALPSVSLDDDDGSSGVGLAAAAAVSAAMARAWASAASKEQRAAVAAAGGRAGGGGADGRGGDGRGGDGRGGAGGGSGRAGFRLVATVTNKMGKRPSSATALSSYASQDSLADAATGAAAAAGGGSGSAGPDRQQHSADAPAPPSASTTAPSSAGSSRPGSSSGATGATSRLAGPSPMASAAAAAAAAAGESGGKPPPSPLTAGSGSGAPRAPPSVPSSVVGGAPNTGQATTISLQWLSRPRTVLLMRKLAPTTESAFLRALDWLRRHHVTIFVEPKVFEELVASGRVVPTQPPPQQQQQQQQQDSGGGGSALALPHSSSANGSGGSSGSLSGLLVSTAQHAPSAAGGLLAPSNSWPGPTGGGPAAAAAAAAAASAAAAVTGAGGAGAGTVKTWQPELHIDQRQQQLAGGGGDAAAAGGPVMTSSDLIPEAVAQQLDLVVVLGGDGTVLWTCHIFGNRSVPPLVPFNLGSLGFLTPFDPARLEQVLLKTFRGGFPITLRHRLHCTIVRCGGSKPGGGADGGGDSGDGLPCVSRSCVGHCVYGEEHVSLNEVVIERGISPFLTNLECFCDGTFVTHVQGDGLIVGTPTGSTAYSLAAGGSMVHPQVPCILFTPICPHSLSFRPLMFPDYVQLCVQVPVDARGHVWASFDGKDRTELSPGDAVVMRLSKWPVPSVAAEADPSSDWFSAVRECLHWNLRKVQGGAGM